MTRASELAKQAVDNVWLTLAQRIVTLFLVPVTLTGGWMFISSYITLRDRVAVAEGDVRIVQEQARGLASLAAGLRSDLNLHAGNVVRLQAQREGDQQLGRRIDELREDVRAVNGRLDQMMTPSRRAVP